MIIKLLRAKEWWTTMEQNSGLVSIIMPLFNSEKYISESIQSVLNQTYTNWELIIVNDCSTDKSVEIVKLFEDKRIKLLHNKKNSGAALSRNYALREAKGKWIAFLDADDQWLPEKLEKQIIFMEKNNYHVSYTDYRACVNGVWEKYIRTAPNKINYRKIINYCYPFTSTVMYEREVIGLVQIQDLKKNNDYAMWLHVFKDKMGFRLSECLSFYIKHENSISNVKKSRLIKYHFQLFKQELRKNSFSSFWLTINNLWHGIWKKIVYKTKIRKQTAMANRNILVICHLTGSLCTGQESKTIDTINYLKSKHYYVSIFNYGKYNFIKTVTKSICLLKNFKKVVLMPGGINALRFFTTIIPNNKDVHYMTIGGWITNYVTSKKNIITKRMKKFKGIYLQNQKSVNIFEKSGFNNVVFVSNFSSKIPISIETFTEKTNEIVNSTSINFCFFARVIREKGVLLACEAIKRIRNEYGFDIHLDIFGEVEDDNLKNAITSSYSEIASLKGVLVGDQTTAVLSGYYALLFPTFYPGEGTPHSIIESFMSGLPVIASDWMYNSELIAHLKTGLIFSLDLEDDLKEKIVWAINNKEKLIQMRHNCLKESEKYSRETLLREFEERIK